MVMIYGRTGIGNGHGIVQYTNFVTRIDRFMKVIVHRIIRGICVSKKPVIEVEFAMLTSCMFIFPLCLIVYYSKQRPKTWCLDLSLRKPEYNHEKVTSEMRMLSSTSHSLPEDSSAGHYSGTITIRAL